MGPGAVRAQVTADMDFTRIESTNEIYDPQRFCVQSRQRKILLIAERVVATRENCCTATSARRCSLILMRRMWRKTYLIVRASKRHATTRLIRPFHTRVVFREPSKTLCRCGCGLCARLRTANVLRLTNHVLIKLQRWFEAIVSSAERGDSVQVINSLFVAPAPLEPVPEPGCSSKPGCGRWVAVPWLRLRS